MSQNISNKAETSGPSSSKDNVQTPKYESESESFFNVDINTIGELQSHFKLSSSPSIGGDSSGKTTS